MDGGLRRYVVGGRRSRGWRGARAGGSVHAGPWRIFADVDPDNLASIRTFEQLGFRHEGVLRGNWETHIGVRDSVILGLLRSDPRPWR